MNPRILIADDDASVRSALNKLMRANGYATLLAENGEQALKLLLSQGADLVLLDLVMPVMDSYQLISKLRELQQTLPILVISGEMDEYDIVYALGLGADDYITKPFVPIVLNAKINAMLRRTPPSLQEEKALVYPPFRLCLSSRKLYKAEKEIPLSEKEYRLMHFLMLHAETICLPEQLYRCAWGEELPDRNTVMVHIHRLRGKIEENPKNPVYIETVRGSGYRFSVS